MPVNTFHPSINSQISHELRMPLSGILGCVDFLNKTSLTTEQNEYVELILTSANRLLAAEEKIFLLVTQKNPSTY